MVSGSQGVGTWYAIAHWDWSAGGVVFESLSPAGDESVYVCPGYLDMHDPLCPWVIVERHMTKAEVEAKGGSERWQWKNTQDLWCDNRGKVASMEEYSKASASPSRDDQYAPDTITVLYKFYRRGEESYEAPGGEVDLPPEKQYMACPNCPYRDMQHERMPDGNLPEQGTACPECLMKAMMGEIPAPSYLYRVSRETVTEQRQRQVPMKLCIVAPLLGRVFYEGPDQAPCRSFRIFQLRAYEIPYEHRGGCDTLLYWSLQALMDALRRQMYEQMVTSKPVIIMGGDPTNGRGLVDSKGRPFRYDDTNGQMAYAPDVSPGMGISQLIHQFQGAGMPNSAPELFSIISSSFYQTKSTGQVAFGPERSRDVATGTLRLMQETGDVPIDDHREILFEEEGLFLGCVLDLIVHNAPLEWWEACFGPEANQALQLLRAERGPNVDVIVGVTPTVKQGAIEEIKAMAEWATLPYAALRAEAAPRIGVSMKTLAAIEMEIQQQMQMQQMAAMQQSSNGKPAAAKPEQAQAA